MATARRRSTDHFAATCTALDLVGHFVYLNAPADVRTSDVFVLDHIQTIGIIVSKSSSTDCIVQRQGEVVGLYAGLTPGRRVMVDEAGLPTHTFTRPVTGLKWIQWAGIATSGSSIYLELQAPVGVLP